MSNKYQFGDFEVELPEFQFRKVFPIFTLVFIILLVFLSFYSVQADEQGVVLRLGKYHSITQPGLRFKFPFIDEVHMVKVQKQHVEEFGFRTLKPGKRTQFSNTYEDEAWTLTNDLSIAEVKWQVQYNIKNPKDYLFNVKNVESTIRDVSESVMRIIVGKQEFDKVIKEGRQIISLDTKDSMQEKLDQLKTGVQIKMVQLQAVLPPSTVMDAYNQVARALQNMEKMINEAQRDSSLKLTQARGEALKIMNQAQGYHYRVVLQAEGETQQYQKVYQSYLLDKKVFIISKMLDAMTEIYSNVDRLHFIDPEIGIVPLLGLNSVNSGFDKFVRDKNAYRGD